jgi:ATP-dependent exoDNAse (exonuclease V) beta subunit
MEKEASNSVKAMFEADEWASKTAKTDKKQQIAELRPHFYEVYERIERLKGEWLLLENVLQHFYRLSVINEIGRELRRLKADKNQVHIGDFNQALISIILSEPVPFIYERLGEKYNHILIDEFQDTSVLQWHNLLPLVENGLSKGHFSLVVGDAKQAIYGFRGGDMEQIVHLSNKRFTDLVRRHPTPDLMGTRYDTVGHTLALERLNTNYRSAREIVEFNNDIFSVLAGLYAENRQLLADVYDSFAAQETPTNARSGGHVEVRFLDTARDDDNTSLFSAYELRTLEAVLRTIREAEEIGYELGDVAVLCRFNKNARWVADYLKTQGVEVVSQDSLLLRSSPAVSLLAAFLRTLHTPGDGLARYEALSLFYQHVLQEPPRLNPEEWDRLRGSSSLGPLYRHLESKGYLLNPFKLQHLGLYELGEKLVQTFRLADMHGQSAYVYRFLDVLLDFSTKQSNHLAAFMEYWERKQDSLCINTPKGARAVTVTSVHKSKGLEYPVVIVPFADWNMHPRPTEIWWMSLDKSRLAYESPFLNDLPLLATPVTPKKELLRTPLRDQYQADTEKHFIENLNMLYVALTRPTDRLYLFSSKYEEKKGEQVSVSRLLHDYLATTANWDPQCPHYILHEGTLKPTPKTAAEAAETLVLQSTPVADWHRTARLRRMAARLFDTDTLDRANDPPRLLAEALRRLEHRDELDVCLDRLEAEGAFGAAARPALRRDLLELLAHPALAPHFAPDAGLKPVKDILSRHTLNLTPPDRVMVSGQAVTILGYVTQDPTEDDTKVLSRYAKALKQMGYEQVEQLMVNTQTLEVMEATTAAAEMTRL